MLICCEVFNFSHISLFLCHSLFIECDESCCLSHSTTYLAVRLLVHRLSTELAGASRSLLIAAASGPMYGNLFCIRQLLSDVSFM
jgi:hypothetical protein